jgi:AGCS family alanine or glycine:cation symporter
MFIFFIINGINEFLWGYIASTLIIIFGFALTYSSGLFKLSKYVTIFKYCLAYLKKKNAKNKFKGINPVKIFFTALGGCVGIGNIATTALATQIGGPGVLLWMWIIACLGISLKYAEIFLGIKYRLKYLYGFAGGPMLFLQKAFPTYKAISYMFSVCMCIYGIEVYMFTVIRDSLSINWGIPESMTSIFIVLVILLGISGGIKRISNISSLFIPLFVIIFLLMMFYILFLNIEKVPSALFLIYSSALNKNAAIGGFTGSTLLLTISKGISTACYSSDVAIGYTSIIHSQAHTTSIKRQSSFSILSVFLDTFIICTLSILLIIITDTWQGPINSNLIVQLSLQRYFPLLYLFMPILLFALGYSTILPYMEAGLKSANFLYPKHGSKIYIFFGILLFFTFSHMTSKYALILMNLTGGILILLNLFSIIKMRRKIDYNL